MKWQEFVVSNPGKYGCQCPLNTTDSQLVKHSLGLHFGNNGPDLKTLRS
uniref:Uncharacterized protein n=1 Tax=Anguilla anguilla TaxID=7936 RepID=A0A0E9W710_ANGAN